MNAVTVNQAYIFFIFMLNGIIIGIIFDIFRILRRSFKTSNLITYIEDMIFWTISALLVMYSLFIFNNGELRGYIFIGLLLGVAVYILFFSKTVIKVSVSIILFVKKVFLAIFRIISYPLKIIFNLINGIFRRLINFCGNLSNKLKKRI